MDSTGLGRLGLGVFCSSEDDGMTDELKPCPFCGGGNLGRLRHTTMQRDPRVNTVVEAKGIYLIMDNGYAVNRSELVEIVEIRHD